MVEAVRFLSQLAKVDVSQSRSGQRERRRNPRFSVHEPLTVQPLNPFSSDTFEASLENISRGGMQLYTATLLGAGTLIKLHLRGAIIGIQLSDAL